MSQIKSTRRPLVQGGYLVHFVALNKVGFNFEHVKICSLLANWALVSSWIRKPLCVWFPVSQIKKIDFSFAFKISEICSELDVDGLRGDIVTNRAAKAIAAFEGRTEVTTDDIRRVIVLCLRHRLRKDPLESIDSGYKVEKSVARVFGLDEEE